MYFLRRLLFVLPLLIVISLFSFLLMHAAPGNPFDKERAPASPEIERALKAKYHLDQPIWKQYLIYLKGLCQGDFGPSLKYRNHSVNDIIAQALPVSMTLGVLSFLFAQGIGIPLGFFMAANRGKWPDYAGSFFAVLAVCIPGLVVGPLLVLGFAIHWRLLPSALWETPWHAILPTIALGLYFAGRVARLMREGMSQILQEPYITTARAKGLDETRVLLRHGFRLAVLPVISYSGPLLADLLTGSFVVESIFRIPGIGIFFINSQDNLDYPMMMGLVLLYAFLLVLLNLLVDFSYGLLDPRVKYE